MRTNYTPGPWTLDVTPTGWLLVSNGADITAQAFDCSDADARLIAAAPDLLAALQEMLKYAEGFEDADHVIDARAAIARATSED